jgi:hypothetical protein
MQDDFLEQMTPDAIRKLAYSIVKPVQLKMLALKTHDPLVCEKLLIKRLDESRYRDIKNNLVKKQTLSIFKKVLRSARYEIRDRVKDLAQGIIERLNEASFTRINLFPSDVNTSSSISSGSSELNNEIMEVMMENQVDDDEANENPIEAPNSQLDADEPADKANCSTDLDAAEVDGRVIPFWKVPTISNIAFLTRHHYKAKVTTIFSFINSCPFEISQRSADWLKFWIHSYVLILIRHKHEQMFFPHRFFDLIGSTSTKLKSKENQMQIQQDSVSKLDWILGHVHVPGWDAEDENMEDVYVKVEDADSNMDDDSDSEVY